MSAVFTLEQAAQLVSAYNVKVNAIDTKATNAATAAATADTKATNAAAAANTADGKAENALSLISDLQNEKQEKILKHVITFSDAAGEAYGNFKITVLNHSIANLTAEQIASILNTREALIAISPSSDGTIILNYSNDWHKETIGPAANPYDVLKATCMIMYNDGSVSAGETYQIKASEITQTMTEF